MTAAWRQHPRLEGRFHVDHPDDVQVREDDGEGPDEQTEQQLPGKKWWQFWK